MLKPTLARNLEDFFSSYPLYTYKKRENILFGNEVSPSIYYVMQGAIKTLLQTKEGKELTHTLLGPGDLFPLRGTHYESPPKYTFQALTDVRVCKAPKKEYLDWIRQHPDIFEYIIEGLIKRLNSSVSRLQVLLLGNALQKVEAILLFVGENLGTTQEESILLPFSLTHQEIADMAGLTRETVTIEVDQLRKNGSIDVLKDGTMSIKGSLKAKASIFD